MVAKRYFKGFLAGSEVKLLHRDLSRISRALSDGYIDEVIAKLDEVVGVLENGKKYKEVMPGHKEEDDIRMIHVMR